MLYMIYHGGVSQSVTVYTLDNRQASYVSESAALLSSGNGRLELDTAGIAPGVYYYIVKTKYADREEKSGPKKLVIGR